ncbi:glyoxalase/bleomycin resistance protein/dioxygenase [Halorubrum coriense DSM 10284]|uniref:Glyoxalase/bleomycin resistance protein/dioxygenase n=1 Tax=Halorubrum coriense DSM 10284 TaxID=1227466 RepID=M0EXD9_9EURY|nr:VOC family protein [Halorubrum coriense]ELZ51094.1 glyoxalase/bleomycin resistance protein/dioxygenase [Halorubrum coriense DSM 10284]
MEILHTCLNVADADQAADWYVDELGLERSWEFTTADGDARNVYVADGNGVEFQLSDTEGATPSADGDRYDHVALGVDDVDVAFDEINHYGVVEPPSDHPEAGARVAFVEDPDGHVVELIEPL